MVIPKVCEGFIEGKNLVRMKINRIDTAVFKCNENETYKYLVCVMYRIPKRDVVFLDKNGFNLSPSNVRHKSYLDREVKYTEPNSSILSNKLFSAGKRKTAEKDEIKYKQISGVVKFTAYIQLKTKRKIIYSCKDRNMTVMALNVYYHFLLMKDVVPNVIEIDGKQPSLDEQYALVKDFTLKNMNLVIMDKRIHNMYI